MNYASFDQVLERYDLSFLSKFGGYEKEDYSHEINHEAVQKRVETALSDATKEINLYLSQRYILPLANVPADLVEACIDLAIWRLPQGEAEHSATIKEKCQFWRKSLDQVAEGKLSLEGGNPEIGEDQEGSKKAIFIKVGNTNISDALG